MNDILFFSARGIHLLFSLLSSFSFFLSFFLSFLFSFYLFVCLTPLSLSLSLSIPLYLTFYLYIYLFISFSLPPSLSSSFPCRCRVTALVNTAIFLTLLLARQTECSLSVIDFPQPSLSFVVSFSFLFPFLLSSWGWWFAKELGACMHPLASKPCCCTQKMLSQTIIYYQDDTRRTRNIFPTPPCTHPHAYMWMWSMNKTQDEV